MQTVDSSSTPSFSESATWICTRPQWANENGHPWADEGACLDDQQVLDLVQGLGGDESLAQNRQHLETCASCRSLFADVEGCLTRSRDSGPARAASPVAAASSRYQFLRNIGEGGMGSVVAVWDKVLDRDVAVKTLHPWLRSEASTVVRFLQEAHLMARMEGRGAPRVIDVGSNERGLPFIVMELVEGETLSARIKRKGPLPVEESITLIARICDALAIAHACGVIHRDLKPANVMVTRDRGKLTVKLIDFGLAKVEGAARQASEAGESFGTPGFMPPEQIRDGHDADARSDIWAAGVLLYRCLTGENPFPPQVHVATSLGAYVPASTRRPSVPFALDEIIARCLETNPRHRYATAPDLARALRDVTSMQTVKIKRQRRPQAADPLAYALAVGASFLLGVLLVLLCR